MILGLGTDIIENERIGARYKKHGERFLKRIFTPDEIDYSLSHANPVPYLAARFAVKEAAIKSFNLPGAAEVRMRDVSVAGKVFGKKQLEFSGRAARLVEELGANKFHVSLTHTHTISMAVVILEKV